MESPLHFSAAGYIEIAVDSAYDTLENSNSQVKERFVEAT